MELSPKILIVDDDPKMTDSVKAILSVRGYQIETTNSARTALAYLSKSFFDLAILDIMMPEMSGFQIMDSLDRGNLDTMFIIMTGDASIESAIEAVRKGASDYIRKPFEPDELLIRVENVLRQKQLNDEHKRVEIEKKTLENQLRQSQKMEAIGTLAGGIAHDFNNVLGIIIGNAELAIEAIPENNHVRQHISRILTASTRAEEMINRLLSFSRISDAEKRPLRLNEIIKETLKLLRSSLPANIEIRDKIPEDAFTVLSDSSQINQIILNLCTNAAHAMQESGGILEVRLEKETLNSHSISGFDNLPPGHYCKIVVADNGQGIAKSIMNRIFDPYFTTKESGKGTGMGLAVVHGIVKNHKGDIRVYSKESKGTEFHIYLPLAEEMAYDQGTDFKAVLPKGQEHILLVDDEDMIVDITKEMLEQLGYHISAFINSHEALEAFRMQPGKYDLVITDMTMPNMTGDRLAREMKKIRKDIPVIICTGYNESISKAKSEMSGIQDFVMKPLNMNKLSKIIRKVLDTPFIDRRKDKRYMTKGDSFVLSARGYPGRFSIMDIGRSGLSFRYIMAGTRMKGLERSSIATADESFRISDVRYRTVCDTEILESSPYPEVQVRRCGIQFEALTPLQEEQIDYFIRNYTYEPMDHVGQGSIH